MVRRIVKGVQGVRWRDLAAYFCSFLFFFAAFFSCDGVGGSVMTGSVVVPLSSTSSVERGGAEGL